MSSIQEFKEKYTTYKENTIDIGILELNTTLKYLFSVLFIEMTIGIIIMWYFYPDEYLPLDQFISDLGMNNTYNNISNSKSRLFFILLSSFSSMIMLFISITFFRMVKFGLIYSIFSYLSLLASIGFILSIFPSDNVNTNEGILHYYGATIMFISLTGILIVALITNIHKNNTNIFIVLFTFISIISLWILKYLNINESYPFFQKLFTIIILFSFMYISLTNGWIMDQTEIKKLNEKINGTINGYISKKHNNKYLDEE